MAASARDTKAVPPGYVLVRDRHSYNARGRLKRLGGYWSPDLKGWLLPERSKEEASATLVYAAKVGRELTESEIEHGFADRIGFPCMECGKRVTPAQARARGGCAEDWYCGCAEARKALR